MKEIRFFYAPDVAVDAELPVDEAAHACGLAACRRR